MKLSKEQYTDIAAGAVALALIVGLGVFLLLSHNNKQTDTNAALTQYQALKPCDLLTTAEATEVLGAGSRKVQDTTPQSNGDLSIATCSYSDGAKTEDDLKLASLTIRSALNDEGIQSNKRGFDQNKTDIMLSVEGYGDAAYYDAAKGQFNILKGRNWMIVTNGKTDPMNDTLEDAKLVADKVFN